MASDEPKKPCETSCEALAVNENKPNTAASNVFSMARSSIVPDILREFANGQSK
jgi:hypothetical protein